MTGDYLQLGASLYVPATRPDLAAIANGTRFGVLRSVIFCTEDAVHAHQVEAALGQLEEALGQIEPTTTRRFVRVRNPVVMARLLTFHGIDRISGFVLPKTTARNLSAYLELLSNRDRFWLMPTLESAEVFDPREMRRFCEMLDKSPIRSRILALRIGGNDLLNLLGLRRSRHGTVYDTPLGPTLAMLVSVFKPAGFQLTAPVFDVFGNEQLLAQEVERDLAHGLFSKSAIHPEQVRTIERGYAVSEEELSLARSILHPDAEAVFRLHDCLCEPATHTAWSENILARWEIYGVRPPHEEITRHYSTRRQT